MSMGGGGKKGGSTVPSERTYLANPITYYKERTGYYPNNTQVWWSMKRPPEVGTDRPPKTYLEVFDPGLRHQVSSGNTPAAKGHYIIDAFQQDRAGVSGVHAIPVKTSNGARPSSVAFYAGRVFYSGVFTSGFNTKIYFTQIIERPDQVGECYQSQDPTSEDLRDLLPSDGGVIVIPQMVQVHHMMAYGFDLYVFASNGVWRIGGSDGLGFRADDYSVSKVSGVPSIGSVNFVDVEGVPLWWNRTGIYTLAPSEQGPLQVVSVTDATIKRFFEKIPEQSKFYAKGTYDPLTKKVQYLYRSEATEDESQIFNYDRILTMDTRTGAWSPWSISEHPRVVMKGLFNLEGSSVEQELRRVLVGSDEVVAATDDVYAIHEYRVIKESKVKYIVNILDESALPPPPDPVPPVVEYVKQSDDQVYVGTDPVMINIWS
jgi:hypothetical protein